MLSRPSARDKKDVARAALLVIGAIGLLFPVIFVLILTQGQQSTRFSRNLDRTFSRQVLIQQLSEALRFAQTNQLAYLLTGDRQFLTSYQEAYAAIPKHLSAVSADGRRIKPEIERLKDLIADKLAELNLTMIVHQFAEPGAGTRIARSSGSQASTEEIGTLINKIRAADLQTTRELSVKVRRQAAVWEAITLMLLTGMVIAMIVASVALADDLRRRHSIEKELNAARQVSQNAREAAEKASAAKTEFLATMSHEIRTPLGGVIGYTELLLESPGLTSEQRDYLYHIQEAGSALLSVVNDVLDFSRVEAGEVLLVAEPFSIPKLVDNAVSIVRSVARKKKLPVRIEMDPLLPKCVLGDAGRVRQVLLNLLNNAVKFTDQGSVTLRLRHIGASGEGDCICFSVTDTGPGISPEQQNRLFKRFSQIDLPGGRRSGGAGLGLAISRRFVELMGGEIGVESAEGQGSTFWFQIPLPVAEADTLSTPEENVPLGDVQPCRILIVDDLEQNRDLARAILQAAGHRVDVAETGGEAVAALQAKPYDLVFMDIQMSDMEGTEATHVIRNLDHPAKDVPIIAMTANVLPQDVRKYRAAGMNDHLGKPYTRAQLLAKVHAVLSPGNGAGELSAKETPGATGDPDGIESLCHFMGREWVVQGLTELKGQLESTFLDADPDALDREQMARNAHMMVSRSSIFGFPELAHLCVRLEKVCKSGQDPSPVFHEGRETSAEVYRRASEMLSRICMDMA